MNLVEVRSIKNSDLISNHARYWLDEDSRRMNRNNEIVADLFCDKNGDEELGTFQMDIFRIVPYIKCPHCHRIISTLSSLNEQREQIHCECRDWTHGHTLLFLKAGAWYYFANAYGKLSEAEFCKNKGVRA